ncbi:MAG: type VI secretion system ATPase TssH [Aquisalimonadaceae bacterium]
MEFDQLIKHLSPCCRDLFEKAVGTASSRTHYAVEIEHWLSQSLEQADPELITVLAHFDVSAEHLGAELQQALEQLKTGNSGFPRIAPDIARLLFESWMLASSQFQSLEIRPVHMLLALTESDALRIRAIGISTEFRKLHGADIRQQCAAVLDGRLQAASARQPGNPTRTPALDQFTIDLTGEARAGRIDPVLGRETEIRQMVDILCRRRQNNPILTGEAGVGKTAVVEGLAQRIVEGDVPHALRDVALRTLDLGLLQAGAGVKGEFENRLKNVIKEVQDAPHPVILFIDEAHTLIGAGNQAGSGDAANLLKPALARGALRTIAATTWSEYKKYFESDAALTRRFQVVKVEEPTEEQAIVMLRGFAEALEAHHEIAILDEAVTAAVRLSNRYIAGRQLPDKCVSLLDTACARVHLSLHTTPPALEDCNRRLDNNATELRRLRMEQITGENHIQAIQALEAESKVLEEDSQSLQNRWQEARDLTDRILTLKDSIQNPQPEISLDANVESQVDSAMSDHEFEQLRDALMVTRRQLRRAQGETPLLYECVDAQVVAEVIADWTGIPVGRMQSDEINGVLNLKAAMQARVIGQPHALDLIGRTMRTARTGLGDPRRPLGVFMLVGPSGVGKTETALALAEQLYGSDESMTVINMSEFKEEHKVSLLMGSPPGYVGYGEGGVLTEAVRRKPYSVVLLDEIEKAHPGVQDIFYQVFDKGILRDGEGRDIDFRNTVIIMTSNTASDVIARLVEDPDTRPDPEALAEAIAPTLRETYKPSFLGRINIIPYYPLEEDSLAKIAELQLSAIRHRVKANYQANLTYGDDLVKHISSRCRQSDTGARQVSALLNNTLLPTLSEQILQQLMTGEPLTHITVDVTNDGDFQILLNCAGGDAVPEAAPGETINVDHAPESHRDTAGVE